MSRFHEALDRRRWAETRRAAFTRDNRRCVRCGKRAVEAHHLIPLNVDVDAAYDLGNVASYCVDCHKFAHRRRIGPLQSALYDWMRELI